MVKELWKLWGYVLATATDPYVIGGLIAMFLQIAYVFLAFKGADLIVSGWCFGAGW